MYTTFAASGAGFVLFCGPEPGTSTGWVHRRVLFGLAVGAFFAYLVAAMPQPSGEHYYWEIMLPGSVLGIIVGYATQRYARSAGAR